jgi:hypothetical protein
VYTRRPWVDRDRQTRRDYISKGGEIDIMNRANLAISATLLRYFFRAFFPQL